MQTFCAHRPKLVNEAVAASFSRMIAANSDFANVEVKIAPAAKSARRYFVQYTPTNPARAEALRQIAEDARDQRATDQRAAYVFLPDSFGRSFHDCCNLVTGETYEVSRHSCSCGDFTFRGSRQSPPVPCKHMRMLAADLVNLAAAANAQAQDASRIAATRARMSEDFPA
jgi:hypothetical protein